MAELGAGGGVSRPGRTTWPALNCERVSASLIELRRFVRRQQGRRAPSSQAARMLAVHAFLDAHPGQFMADAVAFIAVRLCVKWMADDSTEAALVQIAYPALAYRRQRELSAISELFEGIDVELVEPMMSAAGGFDAFVRMNEHGRRDYRTQFLQLQRILSSTRLPPGWTPRPPRVRPKRAAPPAVPSGTGSAGTPPPARRDSRSGG